LSDPPKPRFDLYSLVEANRAEEWASACAALTFSTIVSSAVSFAPSDAIFAARSRKILFDNLLGGVTYVIQLMGIGGSTGQSDWSEPVQGMPK
jgi:hypothetical protein